MDDLQQLTKELIKLNLKYLRTDLHDLITKYTKEIIDSYNNKISNNLKRIELNEELIDFIEDKNTYKNIS